MYWCVDACDVFFRKHQYIGDSDQGNCYLRTRSGLCLSKTAKVIALHELKTIIENELKELEGTSTTTTTTTTEPEAAAEVAE